MDDDKVLNPPIVLRGYDRAQTMALLSAAATALVSDDADLRRSAAQAIDTARIRVVLRGFDRAVVDSELRRLSARLTGGTAPRG